MRLILAGGALLLLLVAVIGGLATQEMTTGQSQPSPAAIADIPTDYLVQYERAALRFGVDWAVLAAIGKIECDHGRSQAPVLQSAGHDERRGCYRADAVPRDDLARGRPADDGAATRASGREREH